ncbi:MAG: hypothetical protein IKU83_03425, partial [Lachnospiraceae bacterium]|nr:hypothetical protein [Lachnospiraceae bacterium]
YPMAAMSKRELRQSAIRVIVYKNRIAMEVFHAVTDGGGTLVFLKSLIAEYLLQKYGVQAKHEHGVVGRLEEPSAEEMEDSFLKYAGPVPLRNKEKFAWRIPGTPEVGGFLHLTCFDIPVKPLLEKAHEQKVTLTVILCAIMFMALQNFQKETVPEQAKRKPLKVFLPVNLRNLFPSKTLRNFALFTRPELQPRLGEYTFDEICKIVQHRMGLDITQKHMSAFMAANVKSEKNLVVRMMPLFIKNTVLKVANVFVGERQSCITMSNLGVVRLPEEMEPYLARFDVILGIPKFLNYNCGVISYGDMVSVNFIRKVQEPGLEYHFHRALQEIGVVACVTSNRPERRDENDVLC